jgi:hypothetical protein
MVFKKIENRRRIVVLKDDDWFETFSGARLPIKEKPMIFGDVLQDFIGDMSKITELEKQRVEALNNNKDFDKADEYAQVVLSYIEKFREAVKMVTNFNGYEIDDEYIQAHMSNEDMYFYMQSVNTGVPQYGFSDMTDKIEEIKKKMKHRVGK